MKENTMTKFFSKSTGGFYPAGMRGDYEAAGTWPADAVEVTDIEHAALLEGQSLGQKIVADATGSPVLQDAPLPTLAELKTRVLDEARDLRTKLFSVVDGLQASALVTALVSGNTADAQAIEDFKVGARNITLVDLGTVADEAVMRDTVQAAYGVLVNAAPVSVKLAFAQALQ